VSEDTNRCQLLNPNPDPWPSEPEISRLPHSGDDHYCVEFQVTAIKGFRFIVLTYPHTHTHTYIHHDRVITISAPLCYVVDADN